MYKVLYYFSNPRIAVLELKRMDRISSDKRLLYYWFLYEKEERKLHHLEFTAMEQRGERQSRFFSGSVLEFDLYKAHYLKEGEPEEVMDVFQDKVLEEDVERAVINYLFHAS